MVVLASIGVITVVVLNSQSSFNKSLILSNTAYDIALTIRSAETFGISSRASGAIANAGYGVHLVKGTTNSFILFADTAGGVSCAGQTPDCKPGDHVYTDDSDTSVQTYALGNGITIRNFCAISATGSKRCSSDGALSSLDISFARPNPDAFISENGSYTAASMACLAVQSPSGDAQRSVWVSVSGQIVANMTPCSYP